MVDKKTQAFPTLKTAEIGVGLSTDLTRFWETLGHGDARIRTLQEEHYKNKRILATKLHKLF